MAFRQSIPAIVCAAVLALGISGQGAAATGSGRASGGEAAALEYTELVEETSTEGSAPAVGAEEQEAYVESAADTDEELSGEHSRTVLRPAYYTASDEDLLSAEAQYSALEAELQFKADNYELLNPGYDEYVYELDDVEHDPYELLSLLSAYLNGYWTLSSAQDAIEDIFESQYTLTETVTEETRYETMTETRTETDAETGKTVIYVERVEAEYTVSVCTVTLEARDMKCLPAEMLTRSQLAEYASYMSILGGAEELFPDSEYQKYVTDTYADYDYDVPEEYLEDESFAAVLAEAERYLGYPYVWGGSYPDTSFDCSGFVWNAFTAAGYEFERTDAQGLYSLCEEVSEDELRPGDLVFFTGTYETDSTVTHVGIYVGDNMMLHAGDPIQYTSLDTEYWQNHLYAFGRLVQD